MHGEVKKYSIQLGEKTVEVTLNKIARQAHGSLLISCGNTTILCTVVVDKHSAEEERSFFPLSVFYVEKSYATGKIPGGFIKREGRPTEREVLVSRVIDRSLRPMFEPDFMLPVTVFCTLLSYGGEDVELLALFGSSIACGLAGLPMTSLIAGFRVLVPADSENPESSENAGGVKLDLFVSGTKDSIIMVESKAAEFSEEDMLSALSFAQENIRPLVEAAEEIVKSNGKTRIEFNAPDDSVLHGKIFAKYASEFKNVFLLVDKQERSEGLFFLRKKISAEFVEQGFSSVAVARVMDSIEKEVVRAKMLKEKRRIDGRGMQDIRHITTEIDILPKECVHGSALFTRGETQALVTTTLGASADEQMLDGVSETGKEHFMLHYNFPSYATGESGPAKSPGRREIGHGKLAWKALSPVMPTYTDFPYVVRVVSEITESNGSSSMATVCGSTLSLLSTGVPLKRPVAGIAMGLIKEGSDILILTDIMGDEDHLGDMDFKVARTEVGITALQMDIKIAGVGMDVMAKALGDAKNACGRILEKITSTINSPATLGDFVPKIEEIHVPVNKIAEIIGKQGANIKEICNVTDSKIDIDPDGRVKIFAKNSSNAEMAKEMIAAMIVELKVGSIYTGKIDKIMPFGAIASLPGRKSGMIHISEIANERIENVSDYLSEGQEVEVKVIGFDDKHRMKLSIKQAMQSSSSENVSDELSPGMQDFESAGNSEDGPRSFFGMVSGLNQKSGATQRGNGNGHSGKKPFNKNRKRN